MSEPLLLVHATAVAVEGEAVLLRGRPGAGKSDLALRLIEAGGALVADDQVELRPAGGRVVARAPLALAGLLEIRGLGIVRFEALSEAPLALVVDLTPRDQIERLPEPRRTAFFGIDVPLVALSAFEASAVAKLRFARRAFTNWPPPDIISR